MKKIKTIKATDKSLWVIAHDGKDTYHFGEITVGNEFSTGLDFLEVYDTEEKMIELINFYKNDPTFYERYLEELDK